MNFLKAFYLTGFTSILVTSVAFVNNIVVTRFLGPEGRGKYSVLVNLITILFLLFGEGIRRTVTVVVGNNRKNISPSITYTIITFFVLIGLFLALIYFNDIWIPYLPNLELELIAITLLGASLIIFWRSLQSIFLGTKDISYYNGLQILYNGGILFFNLIIIYILFLDLASILTVFSLISIIIVLYALFILNKKYDINVREKFDASSNIINLSIKATAVSLLMHVLLKGDLFIVNYFLDSSVTGVYSVSLIFVYLMQRLPIVLGPLIIAKEANNEMGKSLSKLSMLSRLLVLVNFLIAMVLFLFGEQIISILFSSEFIPSYNLLVYILPSLVFLGSGLILQAYYMGKGYPLPIVFINLIATATNVVLNIIFIPQYGIQAAAIICSGSFLLWSLMFIAFYIYNTKQNLFDVIIPKFKDIEQVYLMIMKRA